MRLKREMKIYTNKINYVIREYYYKFETAWSSDKFRPKKSSKFVIYVVSQMILEETWSQK